MSGQRFFPRQPFGAGECMKARVKGIYRNLREKVDLIVLLNSAEPHIDMSFFYATGLTDGLFEGCTAWLYPDGRCEIVTSALEEEAAKLRGKTVPTAKEILKRTTTAEKLVPWISDPLNIVLDIENPEVINVALKTYFDTYINTGQRLTRPYGR